MNGLARFVDAGYSIALANIRDGLHARARAIAQTLCGPLVTTDAVVVETGNSLARFALRRQAATLLRTIRTDPDLKIVPLTAALMARASDPYVARMDEDWGLTDCISFAVMQERGIVEALAHDEHFVQAGLRVLLRE